MASSGILMNVTSRIQLCLLLISLAYLFGCNSINLQQIEPVPITSGIAEENDTQRDGDTNTISQNQPIIAQATLGKRVILPPGVSDQQEFVLEEPVFGGKVYVYEAGKKNPVSIVLIHGWGATGSRDWEFLIPELVRNYHIVAFDLPGFGHSSKQNKLYSPSQYAQLVMWIVKQFTNRSVVVAGHSMGGAIALQFAAMYQQNLEKLILIDVAGILHRAAFVKNTAQLRTSANDIWSLLPDRTLAGINRLIGKSIENVARIQLPMDSVLSSPMLRQDLLKGNPSTISALALIQEDFGPVIEKVKTPTHILWGLDDTIAPLRIGKLLAAKLANADLEVMPNTAHVPMLQHPAAFNLSFKRALAQTTAAKKDQVYEPEMSLKMRNGYCNHQADAVFKGDYDRIEIVGCRNVRLIDVRARSIYLTRSTAEIENSHIKGKNIGIDVDQSTLTATAITIDADVAIMTKGSRLDLAGVTILGKRYAVRAKTKSTVLFSVSHIQSPYSSGYVHDLYQVIPGNPL